jgi:hypothetical protein
MASHDNFVGNFFAPSLEHPDYTLLAKVFSTVGDHIWAFVPLHDLLNCSVASRFCASLPISSDTIQEHINRSSISHIGKFHLKFSPSSTSLGIFRRILFRLNVGSEALISIDEVSGRVIMDIGSAFKDRDTYLASSVTFLPPVSSNDSFISAIDNEEQVMLKHLEVSSYDEYDDFNPTHPLPREKGHRRGGSYFNSDVEIYATQAIDAFDLNNIAFEALTLEGIDEEAVLSNIVTSFGH